MFEVPEAVGSQPRAASNPSDLPEARHRRVVNVLTCLKFPARSAGSGIARTPPGDVGLLERHHVSRRSPSMKDHPLIASACSAALLFLLLTPANALAHCDGLDGPVVKAAQKALDTGNVALVLIWVQEKDDAVIRQAFQKTLAVRTLGPEARNLADLYFFETLVRIHREGEGAPYTGLKPAGRALGPAIPAADKAIDEGSAGPLVKLVTGAVQHGIEEQFKHVVTANTNATSSDVAAGREFVKAYVTFLHYVERMYEAASSPAHGHYPDTAEGSERK
jgi:hypothetical protein